MKIEAPKTYQVEKYIVKDKYGYDIEVRNYGYLPGSDVIRMLKGYKYDEMYEQFFSPKANMSYSVVEA